MAKTANPFDLILEKLESIEATQEEILKSQRAKQPVVKTDDEAEDTIDSKEAAKVAGLTLSGLYSHVHRKIIPSWKRPGSTILNFSRKELIEWRKQRG